MEGASKRLQSEETRQLLLEVGKRLVVEQGTPERIDLRLAEVVKQAGRPAASAYQVWGSQQEFQADLALYLAETLVWADMGRVSQSVADAVATGAEPGSITEVIGRAMFEAFVSGPDFYLTLPFYASRPLRPELAAAMRRAFDRLEEELVDVASLVAERRQLVPAYPGAIEDFAMAAVAVLDGAAMRYLLEPERFAVPTSSGRHPLAEMWRALAMAHFGPVAS